MDYTMAQSPTEPITVRTSSDVVNEIDALASAMDRSRNYVVNQALGRPRRQARLEALRRLTFAEPASQDLNDIIDYIALAPA
jgi:hypothetical protein